MKNSGIKRVTAKSDVFKLAVDNEYGEEMGILSINIGDINLAHRLQQGYEKTNKIIEKGNADLKKIGYDEADKSIMSNAPYFEKVSDIDRELKETFNWMFGGDFSSIFGNTNLMSPTKDGHLILNVLDAIIPAIKKEMQVRKGNMEKNYKEFKENH